MWLFAGGGGTLSYARGGSLMLREGRAALVPDGSRVGRYLARVSRLTVSPNTTGQRDFIFCQAQ